jgi:Autophagy-related protein 101
MSEERQSNCLDLFLMKNESCTYSNSIQHRYSVYCHCQFLFQPNNISLFETSSWEQWILRVVVNNTPRPIGDHSTAIIERQRLLDTTENMLRNVLHQVLDLAGAGDLQHIPPISYEFELSTPKRVAGSSTTSGGIATTNTSTTSSMATKDDREHVYARVAHMPSLLQLGN